MTALAMRGVKKHFRAVQALAGVDLDVAEGEVHALLGENGAGKSTLMKVLSGAVTPDAGEMTLGGAPYRPAGPRDAGARGVRMIYQELTLAPHLTVAENVVLGAEPRTFGVVRRRVAYEIAERALVRLGRPDLSPAKQVGELGQGERQLVEIARALAARAFVIVMDEPTSSLPRSDAERLFDIVRRLAKEGVAVIYISHFLEEIARVADRFTVLRDGLTVATGDVRGSTEKELVEHMAGRTVGEIFSRVAHAEGEEVLATKGLSGARLPAEVNLSLHRGEIFGIAGLLGAGRSETLRTIFGLRPVTSGTIRIKGSTDRGRAPWARLEQGVGLLSEERAAEGLALGMSVADNVTLCHLGRLARYGFIDRGKELERARRWIRELAIRCPDPAHFAGSLSGGNQQKVALARLLDRDVDVLLLDEPTRGVDVGSRVEIYRAVGGLARGGKAILFVSSYLPELLGVCDRIAVMHRGRLSAPRPANEWTEAGILEVAATGASS